MEDLLGMSTIGDKAINHVFRTHGLTARDKHDTKSDNIFEVTLEFEDVLIVLLGGPGHD